MIRAVTLPNGDNLVGLDRAVFREGTIQMAAPAYTC